MFYLKAVFTSFCFVWLWDTLPRFRYHKLMYLAWKSFLSVALKCLFSFLGLKVMFLVSLL